MFQEHLFLYCLFFAETVPKEQQLQLRCRGHEGTPFLIS